VGGEAGQIDPVEPRTYTKVSSFTYLYVYGMVSPNPWGKSKERELAYPKVLLK
jgi:hypothetical protein